MSFHTQEKYSKKQPFLLFRAIIVYFSAPIELPKYVITCLLAFNINSLKEFQKRYKSNSKGFYLYLLQDTKEPFLKLNL